MLTIRVKFVASELAPGLTDGEYNIEDGSTVLNLLKLCESACGASVPPKNFDFMLPLFNGKPVMLSSAITEDGTLHLCRIIAGG